MRRSEIFCIAIMEKFLANSLQGMSKEKGDRVINEFLRLVYCEMSLKQK